MGFQNTRRSNFNKPAAILTCIIGSVLCVVFFLVFECISPHTDEIIQCHLFGDTNSYNNMLTLFTCQISLTFTSISVLSILSDRSCLIYWKNIVDEKLRLPLFSSFAALTCYSIGTIAIAFFAIIIQGYALYAAVFMANFIIIAYLATSVLDVYFNKRVHQKKMVKELTEAFEQYGSDKSTYVSLMHHLKWNLAKADNEDDFDFLQDCFELYCEHNVLFCTKEGRSVILELAKRIGKRYEGGFCESIFSQLISCVVQTSEKTVTEIIDSKNDGSPLEIDNFVWDRPFWAALYDESNREFYGNIRYGSVDTLFLEPIENILCKRFVAFYNCMAALYCRNNNLDIKNYKLKITDDLIIQYEYNDGDVSWENEIRRTPLEIVNHYMKLEGIEVLDEDYETEIEAFIETMAKCFDTLYTVRSEKHGNEWTTFSFSEKCPYYQLYFNSRAELWKELPTRAKGIFGI